MELENPFASVLDSATSGMNALHAEWHAGSDQNKFSGVSNRMVILWINDAYLEKSNEQSHKMMGNER